MTIIVNILIFITIWMFVYFLFSSIKIKKIKNKITQTKVYNKLSEYIFVSVKKNLLKGKVAIQSPIILILIMLLLFIMAFLLFNFYLKIPITSLILSIPFLLLPIIILKILLNKEKANIIKLLPMYVINIKNHISEDNNIISAIQRTIVEEPLKKYIDQFKMNVSRGINTIEAFELLKEEVDVKDFTDFINSCEVCYLNGGNFVKVLECYIDIITKENVHKESTREKAYADILTLIIMIILNILVVVLFVFNNDEYAHIMRTTFLGNLILNFNAVSYILIAYLISRIYKEE